MQNHEDKKIHNDQAWFEALSGQTEAGSVAQLRKAMRDAELADAGQEDINHDWQRLQFALRRETLQKVKKNSHGMSYFAIAASLLLFTFTIKMFMQFGEAPSPASMKEGVSVMRGKSEQVIFSATPLKDADQLETALLQHGAKVYRHNSADKVELHIQLSYPVSDEIRSVLEQRMIPVPEQDDLAVLFVLSTE